MIHWLTIVRQGILLGAEMCKLWEPLLTNYYWEYFQNIILSTGCLRKIWLKMNCFVSKQPNLREQIVIMKSSSNYCCCQAVSWRDWGFGKWVVPFLSFPQVTGMGLTQKLGIYFSAMVSLTCHPARLESPFILRCESRCCGKGVFGMWSSPPPGRLP